MAAKGEWVEQIDKRTCNAKSFVGSGDPRKHSVDVAIGAIHYQETPNVKGSPWLDIDTRVSKDGKVNKSPYDLEVYLSGMPGFHYVSKESGEFHVRLRAARMPNLARATDILPIIPKPKIEGNKVIWRDIYPDTDLILLADNTQVHLERLIKSPKAPLEFDIDIDERKVGVAKLRPLMPARDANGQLLVMQNEKIAGGRRERLKLEVLAEEGVKPEPIAYPILDSTVVDEVVSGGDDDAYEDGAGGFYRVVNYIVIDSNTNTGIADYRCGGARFRTVNVPNASVIDTAYGRFWGASGAHDDANMKIYGNAVDDAVDFLADASIIGRARTTDFASYVQDGVYVGGYRNGPEMKAVIQELVNRPLWVANNDMVLLYIANSDMTKTYWVTSFKLVGSAWALRLHIEWSPPPVAGGAGMAAKLVGAGLI